MEARDYVKALLDFGLTQTEISEKTGIPQPTISKVFRGDVADVLSRNYRKLQELHVSCERKARAQEKRTAAQTPEPKAA